MSEEDRKTLEYAPPKPAREMPWWAHLASLIILILPYLAVYSLAIAGPMFTVAAVYLVLVDPPSNLHAFGEPIVTTWQKARAILYPVALSAVSIPLAVWLRRRGREQ